MKKGLHEATFYDEMGLCGDAVDLSVLHASVSMLLQPHNARKSNKLNHLLSKLEAGCDYFVFH